MPPRPNLSSLGGGEGEDSHNREKCRFDMKMNADIEPKLAPPGAGLPKVELRIARLMFAWQRQMGSRESFAAKFQKEREIVRGSVCRCDENSAARRVLIERVPGLEDSSRYWSVWMTLDHLRIMHGLVARTIEMLGAGTIPSGQVNTANVKPSLQVAAAVVGEYEKSCDAVLAAAAGVTDLNTTPRYLHPWFGPLNALGWFALTGTHLAVHRAQIERIIAGLKG